MSPMNHSACRWASSSWRPSSRSRSSPYSTERVEHPVPLAVGFAGHDGLLDQPAQRVEDRLGRQFLVGADVLGRLHLESAREDRQPLPQQPLARRAQLVAPADRRTQRLMPGQRRAGAAQQPEPVVEAGHDLLDGHGAQSAGGQFDRERDPVETLAKPDHGLLVARLDPEPGCTAAARSRKSASASESPIPIVPARGRAPTAGRAAGGAHQDVEGLPAGRDDPQRRRGPQ